MNELKKCSVKNCNKPATRCKRSFMGQLYHNVCDEHYDNTAPYFGRMGDGLEMGLRDIRTDERLALDGMTNIREFPL